MKTVATLFIGILFFANNLFAQELEKKPLRREVGSYNQANLLNVDLGASKNKVIEVMGGVRKIQTYTNTNFVTRKESVIINNPFSRDFKTDTSGNTIEILWYYTNVNKADGTITKEQQTPIILEKNAVVGMGWEFYEDYAKRKGITIEQK